MGREVDHLQAHLEITDKINGLEQQIEILENSRAEKSEQIRKHVERFFSRYVDAMFDVANLDFRAVPRLLRVITGITLEDGLVTISSEENSCNCCRDMEYSSFSFPVAMLDMSDQVLEIFIKNKKQMRLRSEELGLEKKRQEEALQQEKNERELLEKLQKKYPQG